MTVEEFKRAAIEVCRFAFDEMQGHAPSDLYEDGYSDACAECEKRIKRLETNS